MKPGEEQERKRGAGERGEEQEREEQEREEREEQERERSRAELRREGHGSGSMGPSIQMAYFAVKKTDLLIIFRSSQISSLFVGL